MRNTLMALALVGTFAMGGAVGVFAQAQAPSAAPQPAMANVTPAPTDKAGYYLYKDNQKIWAELEKGGPFVRRVAEGGKYSINVRVVRDTDQPMTHGASADVWVVQDGTANSVTGGTIPGAAKRGNSDDYVGKEIVGGVTQPVSRGDIVFVPKGVPHTFRDMKGFRAYLIRFDTP